MRINLFTVSVVGVLLAVGCAGKAPTGTSMMTAVNREPWQGPQLTGEKITSAHYRIFTTTQRSSLLSMMPGFMEAAYGNYLRMTGLPERALKEPMPIYLMASRDEWAAVTKAVMGPGSSEIALQIEAGGYCYEGVCVFWAMHGLGTLSTASHEGLHQFLHHRLKDRLPMWLEEGLCASAEGFELRGDDAVLFTSDYNASRFNNLRSTITQNRFIPLSQLVSMDAGEAINGKPTEVAVGYYGQLWALSVFIRTDERYREGFRRMLADAAAGRFNETLKLPPQAVEEMRQRPRIYNKTFSEPLFRHYISDDPDGFDRHYRAFCYKLCGLEF